MNGVIYWQWHYLVFLAPAGASALLLLLSNLRLGKRAGHRSGKATKVATHRSAPGKRNPAATSPASIHGAGDFLLALIGFHRMPLVLFLQMFFLFGGLAGFWANRWFLQNNPSPTIMQWLPCLAIAVGTGFICARLSAEVLLRLTPRDASSIVTRDGLIGLTGKVVFPISDSSGRVHLYDDFGTLHDEICRVPRGHPGIDRGSFARIIDRDSSGRFLVEEAAEPLRFR